MARTSEIVTTANELLFSQAPVQNLTELSQRLVFEETEYWAEALYALISPQELSRAVRREYIQEILPPFLQHCSLDEKLEVLTYVATQHQDLVSWLHLDGPAQAGKTTITREIARRLKASFFSTGNLYRAIAYARFVKKQSLEQIEPYLRFDVVSGNVVLEEVILTNNELRSDLVEKSVAHVALDVAVRHLVDAVWIEAIKTAAANEILLVSEGRDGYTKLPKLPASIEAVLLYCHASSHARVGRQLEERLERIKQKIRDHITLTPEEHHFFYFFTPLEEEVWQEIRRGDFKNVPNEYQLELTDKVQQLERRDRLDQEREVDPLLTLKQVQSDRRFSSRYQGEMNTSNGLPAHVSIKEGVVKTLTHLLHLPTHDSQPVSIHST